ncbi:MAG: deoxyribodipyrimidine photo-lyase [Candidatus Zixiibacteriota bacterium]|nr:MAG: deoxyribodipyrimidine photo-lyase [candidate division Zixibacteria bacterium]
MDKGRARSLNDAPIRSGPVVYWMSRDQRVRDNWALLYAQDLAVHLKRPLAVVFNLVPEFLGATLRQYAFMLAGLRQVADELERYDIPFILTIGRPERTLPQLARDTDIAGLVTDFSPLRLSRRWKTAVVDKLDLPVHEVDAHNIVPCWIGSPKLEYAAYTFRPRITRLLSEFLKEFPKPRRHPVPWRGATSRPDFENAMETLRVDRSVEEVPHVEPGENAARRVLRRFIKTQLPSYAGLRNDPTRGVQSQLSPYLHFGQIAPQRVALEVSKHAEDIRSQEAFLEELIVRRELAENFCYYNESYDSFQGFPDWARKTLDVHRTDPRQHLYDPDELENAATHDMLWNAAQMEMARAGKMHGYMRMYWAKKILEWSPSPEIALETAIYLNDRYQLDGRDPNGYAGIAWSIGGVHDRPWFERDIFGKIRYMSYEGCRRKFDVQGYILKVDSLI